MSSMKKILGYILHKAWGKFNRSCMLCQLLNMTIFKVLLYQLHIDITWIQVSLVRTLNFIVINGKGILNKTECTLSLFLFSGYNFLAFLLIDVTENLRFQFADSWRCGDDGVVSIKTGTHSLHVLTRLAF